MCIRDRIGAALGTFLLPILMESIGGTGTLIVCAAILVLGGVVCQIFAPETFAKFVEEEKMIEKLKEKNHGTRLYEEN